MTNQGITEICKKFNKNVEKTGNCFYCVFEWLGKDCKKSLENYFKSEIIKIPEKFEFCKDAKCPEIIKNGLYDF